MNVIVTCGPSYEPIDQVRRITNFSTGRLGITLANAFHDAGHHVICLKGEQATDPTQIKSKALSFSTNDDLATKIKTLPADLILHAAALCDFKVASVENSHGTKIQSAKFPTRADPLTLRLEPTTKILPQLRTWFPKAQIIGWKYELEGTREEALKKAHIQIEQCKTDASVLNGAAYGKGFALISGKRDAHSRNIEAVEDNESLSVLLLKRFGQPGS
jgi:phosphopantothenoylcysteine synthetase/decarboxylase